ncbi:conserved protein of unknown function [Tenacibaculum sp. 190130A14a]|uniref:Interferon-induced transmembrane protein n=1 Tax=Tenacibaculum polynesiense TaxID=3137857 RepID=A0ABM9PF71_9FLAO
MKKKLNPTIVYVLSIVSFLCCCFLGMGTFLALPAFLMANKGVKGAEENPEAYEGDVQAMKTAKTVAMIALIVNGLYLLYSIYSLATTDWDVFWETYNKALEQYQ